LGKDNPPSEVMLAQEQAVIRRGPGIRKGVEAAFGLGGETEGTLVLTDRRLVYVHGDEKEEDLRVGALSAKRLYFSDVESLDSMSLDSESLEIPISEITDIAGHRSSAVAPKLEVRWGGKTTEFVQQVTGSTRSRNLSDWAAVVLKLKANQLKLDSLPAAPSDSTLDGRVVAVLGDMQQKGLLTIEEEVEERYRVDLDPDEVEAACERLVKSGLLRRFAPAGEDTSYQKVSPLGNDDLNA
jgi:hypothetical protein